MKIKNVILGTILGAGLYCVAGGGIGMAQEAVARELNEFQGKTVAIEAEVDEFPGKNFLIVTGADVVEGPSNSYPPSVQCSNIRAYLNPLINRHPGEKLALPQLQYIYNNFRPSLNISKLKLNMPLTKVISIFCPSLPQGNVRVIR